ncbi:hypothetical protein OSTOST_05615 [Ostertagia ostertagi]
MMMMMIQLSTHGFPETLVSDNGSQFTSLEFTEFCKKNGITHIRSPPYHRTVGNGQVEEIQLNTSRVDLEEAERALEGIAREALQKFLMTYPHHSL